MFYNFGCLAYQSSWLQKREFKKSPLGGHELTGKNSLYEKQGNYGYLWFNPGLTPGLCYEDNYFPKRKFKLFYSCFSQCTLFFLCFLLPICLPWVICGKLCDETSRQSDNGPNVYQKQRTCKTKSFFKAVTLCSDF